MDRECIVFLYFLKVCWVASKSKSINFLSGSPTRFFGSQQNTCIHIRETREWTSATLWFRWPEERVRIAKNIMTMWSRNAVSLSLYIPFYFLFFFLSLFQVFLFIHRIVQTSFFFIYLISLPPNFILFFYFFYFKIESYECECRPATQWL